MQILVIGCGRMGAGLAQRLAEQGHALTVVDSDAGASARLGPTFSGQTVIGDGMDRAVLSRAGIARADGLAAVTGSDEVNVVVARIARQIYRVPQVTARIYDPRKAEIYQRLGLLTVAPVTWGIARMVESLTLREISPRFSLGNGAVDIVEIAVPAPLAGHTVHDLVIPGDIAVVAVQRAGSAFLPDAATRLDAGDVIFVAVSADATERLNAMLGML
jgi:trk system potassium uptake protein TrkA